MSLPQRFGCDRAELVTLAVDQRKS